MLFEGTTPLSINVDIRNHGQTPASRVVYFAAVHFKGYPLPKGYDPGDPGDAKSTQGIWPDTVHSYTRPLGKPIRPELLQELQSGAVRIYLFGLVKYEDIFGKSHYTKLCASFDWRTRESAPRTTDEVTGKDAFAFNWEYDHQHNDFD